jgi:hypothetical protein
MIPGRLWGRARVLQAAEKVVPGESATSAAKEAAEKVDFGAAAPKGACDFEGLAVSLKRYPDTKPEFFRSL